MPMSGVLYLYSVATSAPNIQSVWFTKADKDTKTMFTRMHGAAHFRLSQAGEQ